MDMVFSCPSCKQQLEADASMSGNEITCPSCQGSIVIPEANAVNIRVNAIATSAAAKEEYHFKVPVHEGPAQPLIQKPNRPLEVAAKEGDRQMRVKTIRRTDCVEVGRDLFDDSVSEFLNKVGEAHIVSITPITYTHLDLGTRQLMTDFGVMIIYKG
jgi:DNA-directed RNA polymerase subunit RPC12/RpoP